MEDISKHRKTDYALSNNQYFSHNKPTPLAFDIETYPLEVEYDDNENIKKAWIKECDKKKFNLNDDTILPGTHEYYKNCWYEHASFYPAFARILCISTFGIIDGKEYKESFYSEDELKIIFKFFVLLDHYKVNILIGHNIFDFDIEFIIQRAMSHGYTRRFIPKVINKIGNQKWDMKWVHDTMDVFRMSSRPSLDLLCHQFGIPSPKDGGMDGSKIREFINNGGDLKTVVEYCERDVYANFQVFEKIYSGEEGFLNKIQEKIKKNRRKQYKEPVVR